MNNYVLIFRENKSLTKRIAENSHTHARSERPVLLIDIAHGKPLYSDGADAIIRFFFIRPSSFFLRILELQLMRSPSAEFLAVQIHETSFPI